VKKAQYREKVDSRGGEVKVTSGGRTNDDRGKTDRWSHSENSSTKNKERGINATFKSAGSQQKKSSKKGRY